MHPGISFALKVVAGVAAVSIAAIGLAFAGVDLPGQAAEQAIEAVTGLELPNEGSAEGNSVADQVAAVLDSELEGCELGQAVADAADANRQEEPTTGVDPCIQADANRAQGSRATGQDKSATGRATALEKSNGVAGAGADNAAVNAGRTIGAAKAAEGRSRNPNR